MMFLGVQLAFKSIQSLFNQNDICIQPAHTRKLGCHSLQARVGVMSRCVTPANGGAMIAPNPLDWTVIVNQDIDD